MQDVTNCANNMKYVNKLVKYENEKKMGNRANKHRKAALHHLLAAYLLVISNIR